MSRLVQAALAGGFALAACAGDRASAAAIQPPLRVRSAMELTAALNPANAGRRIELAAGEYAVNRALVVPDDVTLVGAGSMAFDRDGLPAGFARGSVTTLRVSAPFDGDVLTLGNGSRLERLRIIDLETPPAAPMQRHGNAVSIASRAPRDEIAAVIVECEIANPNRVSFTNDGPSGHGVTAQTLNPRLGAPPEPHDGARIALDLRRSIVRTHTGAAVFIINFAPRGRIEAVMQGNRFEGYLNATGGVTRPETVHDAITLIDSRGNLYLRTGLDRHGWHLLGASTSPHIVEGPGHGGKRNQLRVVSDHDRIEGFRVGIQAAAARRLRADSEPLHDNRLELELRGTRIRTEGAGAADLILRGTLSEHEQALGPADFAAGDRNAARVRMTGVRGSGRRNNVYADVEGPSDPGSTGEGNRLVFSGSRAAFLDSNRDLEPAPPARFFEGLSSRAPE